MAITQGSPDFQNIFLDDLWVYVYLGPKCTEDFILRHQPVCVFDQIAKDVESLGGERHTVFPVPQAVVNDVEPEGAEMLHCAEAGSLLTPGKRIPRVYDINAKFALTLIVGAFQS